MRFKTFIPIATGLLLIVALAGAVFLKSLDLSDYKRLLAGQIKAAIGRDLQIRGDMDLSFSLSPALAVHDMTLSNASWGSRPDMLRVKEVTAKLRILPLFSGRMIIDRLVFIAPDILLETDDHGKGNWSFAGSQKQKIPSKTAVASPSRGKGSAFIPLIREVRLEKGVVRFRNGKTGKIQIISLKKLRGFAENVQSSTTITMEGTDHHHPFQVDASLGPLSTLFTSPAPFPVQMEARLLDSVLKIQGTLKNPLQGTGLDLRLSVEGPSLTSLARAAGLEIRSPGPFHLAAYLSDSNATYSLNDIQATLGKSHLAGNVSLQTGEKSPLVRVKITELNWEGDAPISTPHGQDKKISPPSARPVKKPKGKRDVQKSGPKRIFSDTPLPTDSLRAVNFSLTLDRGRILVEGILLKDLRMEMALQGGRLTVSSLHANLAGGNLNGEISLDGTKPRLALKTRIDIEQIPVGALLRSMKLTDLVSSGNARIKVRLQAGGGSVRELMAGLNGNISLVMGESTLNNKYLDFAATDLVKLFMPGGTKKEHTVINCFVCRFDIKEGLATNRGLLLDTGAITVRGKGRINLGHESIDLLLKPRTKKTSLVSLAMPLHIGGTLAEPTIRPDVSGVIKGVAGALLGVAVLGPAGLLEPVVAKGSRDRNPCVAALEAKGRDTGKARPRTEKKQGDGIIGLLKGLGLSGGEKK